MSMLVFEGRIVPLTARESMVMEVISTHGPIQGHDILGLVYRNRTAISPGIVAIMVGRIRGKAKSAGIPAFIDSLWRKGYLVSPSFTLQVERKDRVTIFRLHAAE